MDVKHDPHDWLVPGLIVEDGGGNLQNAQDFSPSLCFWLFFLFYRRWLTQCVVLGFKPRTTWRHTSPFTQWAVQTKPWCGLSLICCWLGLSPLAWHYLRYAHAHTLGFCHALIGCSAVTSVTLSECAPRSPQASLICPPLPAHEHHLKFRPTEGIAVDISTSSGSFKHGVFGQSCEMLQRKQTINQNPAPSPPKHTLTRINPRDSRGGSSPFPNKEGKKPECVKVNAKLCYMHEDNVN